MTNRTKNPLSAEWSKLMTLSQNTKLPKVPCKNPVMTTFWTKIHEELRQNHHIDQWGLIRPNRMQIELVEEYHHHLMTPRGDCKHVFSPFPLGVLFWFWFYLHIFVLCCCFFMFFFPGDFGILGFGIFAGKKLQWKIPRFWLKNEDNFIKICVWKCWELVPTVRIFCWLPFW